MIITTRFAVLATTLALTACATHAPLDAAREGAAAMAGAWTVDLSSEPGVPYTKPMHLTLNPDMSVRGDFYESEILAGRWKTDRGRTCVSFRTSDGVGLYHSAACLVVGAKGELGIQGQTWAEQRSFLFNWNAVKSARGERRS